MTMRIQTMGLRHAFVGSAAPALNLAPGSATLLLGPNGCGKSTLLAMMAGLIRPAEGSVLLDDEPAHVSRARSGLGLMSAHDPSPRRTLRQLQRVLIGPSYWSDLALDDHADVPLASLSSGQRRRASLALALTAGRRALLLDEPLAMLDRASAERVVTTVGERLAAGITTVVATHHPERWTHLSPAHVPLAAS